MGNPYTRIPDYAFWRRAVTKSDPDTFDPVTSVPFTITPHDAVAPTGSCFAQHISRTLAKEGFNYLVTEKAPRSAGAVDQNYGVFPARFGNVYTTRQLLQLFQRAYGQLDPPDRVWKRADGRYVDPFRPQIQDGGFASSEEVEEDRQEHFAAVQEMFETCDVFIFTLGLTEAWRSREDGAVFPLAPGVIANGEGEYEFVNFTAADTADDLTAFLALLRAINPDVRVILTVSPVPLIATYESQHVLLSTVYSKSVLRLAAETVTKASERVAYFPSYEIISGPQARGRYYANDLREVTAEGVAHVMSVFKRHYLHGRTEETAKADPRSLADVVDREREFQMICDEEILDP